MDFVDVHHIVPSVDEGHVAITTFMFLFGEMTRNVPVQVLLRIKGCATGDTFEILGKVFVNNGVVVKGLFAFEGLGANVTHEWRLASMFPLVNLGLVLVAEHHVAVVALYGFDLAMGGIDVPFQMVRFHEGGSAL